MIEINFELVGSDRPEMWVEAFKRILWRKTIPEPSVGINTNSRTFEKPRLLIGFEDIWGEYVKVPYGSTIYITNTRFLAIALDGYGISFQFPITWDQPIMGHNPEEARAYLSLMGQEELDSQLPTKVAPDAIACKIARVDYQTVTLGDKRMVLCGIKMNNGYVAVGAPSICMDDSEWDEDIGRKKAYDNSFASLWALETYLLSEQKYGEKK